MLSTLFWLFILFISFLARAYSHMRKDVVRFVSIQNTGVDWDSFIPAWVNILYWVSPLVMILAVYCGISTAWYIAIPIVVFLNVWISYMKAPQYMFDDLERQSVERMHNMFR